jgi:hypothetical protein
MDSKLLGTFKLPKFDGAAKNWKQWDRDFVRFLGLHQLEHVLLEDFLLALPHPEAVASNKIVYFLVRNTFVRPLSGMATERTSCFAMGLSSPGRRLRPF